MSTRHPSLSLRSAPELLRARAEVVDQWLAEARAKTAMYCFLFIVVGAGAYGAAMGSWRSPTQAIYTGLKLPPPPPPAAPVRAVPLRFSPDRSNFHP